MAGAPPAFLAASARRDPRSRSRWIIALAVGLSLHVGAFLLLRIASPSTAVVPGATPAVVWVGDAALREESTLSEQLGIFDSAPLFLPTERNFASLGQRITDTKPPGEMFDLYRARLSVSPEEGPGALVAAPTAVEASTGALRDFTWPHFRTFGRADTVPQRLPERFARLELRDVLSGSVVWSEVLVRSLAPAGASTWPEWAPFELLLAVESTGVLGPALILERGSGAAAVDGFFRDFLGKTYRVDLRVPAGYYRILVAP